MSIWETASVKDIFEDGIFGNYPWGVYDYTNSINYGDYDDTGMCPTAEPCVLGVTAIWYQGKNIYEYDIVFDTDFFLQEVLGSFDLDTVVLHELGHAAGLDDLYNTVCLNNVMYGYVAEGEVKTVLANGDMAGIQKLYKK